MWYYVKVYEQDDNAWYPVAEFREAQKLHAEEHLKRVIKEYPKNRYRLIQSEKRLKMQ